MSGPPRLALALGLAAAGAVAIVAALLTVGGPGTARLARLDERRSQDLQMLVDRIWRHRTIVGRLPESLAALDLPADLAWRDPATGAPYGYERLGADGFRLCATLSLPEAPPVPERMPLRLGGDRAARPVTGPEGRLCWEAAAPPE